MAPPSRSSLSRFSRGFSSDLNECFDHGGSGQGFEDNYAAGKLFFAALSVKHIAIHNRPAYNSEVWGSRERGVHELNYTYEDARLADTIVLWGANSYETATVFYVEHMLPNIQGATVAEKQQAFDPGEPAEPGTDALGRQRRSQPIGAAVEVGIGKFTRCLQIVDGERRGAPAGVMGDPVVVGGNACHREPGRFR